MNATNCCQCGSKNTVSKINYAFTLRAQSQDVVAPTVMLEAYSCSQCGEEYEHGEMMQRNDHVLIAARQAMKIA